MAVPTMSSADAILLSSSFSSSSWTILLAENPVIWSVAMMLTIVGLLLAWDTAVEAAREEAPSAIRCVIEKMLAEMGGLGFIGLALSKVLHQPQIAQGIQQLSEEYLHDEEILVESFEFLHQAFFQTGMAFFAVAAIIIVQVIGTIEKVSKMAETTVNQTTRAAGSPSTDDCPELTRKLTRIETYSCQKFWKRRMGVFLLVGV
jgi:hypothetical protein